MTDGPLITAWTIRLALLLLAASILLRALQPLWPTSTGMRRIIWTLGCGLFLLHIAAGMHFYHGWSHAAAYDDTAQQTEELLGVRFGGGIYFNHLMALVWTADVLWWWLAPTRYDTRSPRYEQAIVGYFVFIAFNGLVVFKAGALRWSGLVGLSSLLLVWLAVRIASRWSAFPPAQSVAPVEKS